MMPSSLKVNEQQYFELWMELRRIALIHFSTSF